MSPEVHPRALGRILSQIRFGSTLNIAASLASPCRPTHALRGVHSVAVMEQVGAVMRAIGYKSALIVHGFNGDKTAGMDELSTLGESEVLELREDGTSTRYTITPESVGLPCANFEDIASSGNVDLEATRMLMVLAGKGHERRQDHVCLNAGALFYLVKRTPSIEAGVRLARAQLGQAAISLLSRWTKTQASNDVQATQGFAKLRTVANLAGIPLS
jgi:anthranilate phosphoribosyltransferase